MKLIDADAIPWMIVGIGEIPVITKEEVEEMPTVDAVEVVRCENCRHDNNCEIQYAAQAGSKFFCTYGEMKERSEEND